MTVKEVRNIFGSWHYCDIDYNDENPNGAIVGVSKRIRVPIIYDKKDANKKDDKKIKNVNANADNAIKENEEIVDGDVANKGDIDKMDAGMSEELITRRIMEGISEKERKARMESELSETRHGLDALKRTFVDDMAELKSEFKKPKERIPDVMQKLQRTSKYDIDCPTCHKHSLEKVGASLQCTGPECGTKYVLANTKAKHACATCNFPINKSENLEKCPWCGGTKAIPMDSGEE